MENKNNGLDIASFITGLLSLILCWVPFLGLLLGILSIVFFVKGDKKSLGIAGLVLGIIGLVSSFFVTGIVFLAIMTGLWTKW